MKNSLKIRSRSLLCAAAGLLAVTFAVAASKPAAAQSSDAASLCTPDVMRLCSEFIPDEGRIVSCLKAKRRQLSPGCHNALAGGKAKAGTASRSTKSKKRRVRHHRG